MDISERIGKSLYKPCPDSISRVMQVSYNLNRRAYILKQLNQLKKHLSHAIDCLEARHNDSEPLAQLYTDLDYLIENERKKLLQETKSEKG